MHMFDIRPVVTVRGNAILTTGEVSGTVIESVGLMNQLNLLVDFTLGSLTSAEIYVYFSMDGSTWYQKTAGSVSSGVETSSLHSYHLTATGKYCLEVPMKCQFVKVTAKGTGTVTGSSLAIDAVIGTV